LQVDLSIAVEVKFTVWLEVVCDPPSSDLPWFAIRPRFFDPGQLDDPVKTTTFVDLVEGFVPVPWTVDVHSHAVGLAQAIAAALAQAFPSGREGSPEETRVPFRPYLLLGPCQEGLKADRVTVQFSSRSAA
jgi:hypothetical protein